MSAWRMTFVSYVGLVCIGVLGCSSGSGTGGPAGGGGGGSVVKLQGAGASFPAPLYNKWFKDFSSANNAQIDYQSVGSGSGVKQFMDHLVDFGASDAAMKPEEIEQVEEGVQLLPMTAGAIVLAFNLEGVENLKLSRDAYTGIFLGTVTKWNDKVIADANPGVSLPDAPVNVVVRADSSGTTFVFTKHLAEVSSDFNDKVGVNKQPNWPVGTKSKGNEGVTASLASTPGSIGYIEYGYAKGAKLKMATLENKSGQYVEPSTPAFQAALAGIEMPEDLIAWLPDPDGEESYPIVTYTWIMCYKTYDAEEEQVLKDLLTYCLTEGQKSSEKMGYIPLPEPVVAKVQAALDNIGAGS
jgi:phosphate transport system substrate-binding protein